MQLNGTNVLNTNWHPLGIQYLRYFKYFNGTCLFPWSLNINSRLSVNPSNKQYISGAWMDNDKVLTGQCKAHEGKPTDNDRILSPKPAKFFLTNNATVTNYICTSKAELKLKSFWTCQSCPTLLSALMSRNLVVAMSRKYSHSRLSWGLCTMTFTSIWHSCIGTSFTTQLFN